jgi:hypothetical protein
MCSRPERRKKRLPLLRSGFYRMFPRSRRPRVILIGDAIFLRFGGYLLGNLVVSLIAGVATYFWLLVFGVPFPLALAILVALLDFIPVVGSVIRVFRRLPVRGGLSSLPQSVRQGVTGTQSGHGRGVADRRGARRGHRGRGRDTDRCRGTPRLTGSDISPASTKSDPACAGSCAYLTTPTLNEEIPLRELRDNSSLRDDGNVRIKMSDGVR